MEPSVVQGLAGQGEQLQYLFGVLHQSFCHCSGTLFHTHSAGSEILCMLSTPLVSLPQPILVIRPSFLKHHDNLVYLFVRTFKMAPVNWVSVSDQTTKRLPASGLECSAGRSSLCLSACECMRVCVSVCVSVCARHACTCA